MKVLGIAGSLRAASSNGALLRAAARLASAELELEVYEGLGALPHFSPDLDVDPLPEPVRVLRARVAAAGGLLIASPEYAHGMPGCLKNALDWLVSDPAAADKPVLLVSAAPSGAAYAHAQLAEVLRTMSMKVIDGGAHVFSQSHLDAAGECVKESILQALRQGLAELRGSGHSGDR